MGMADAPGHIVLGPYIRLLEVPTGPIDRSMGDVPCARQSPVPPTGVALLGVLYGLAAIVRQVINRFAPKPLIQPATALGR